MRNFAEAFHRELESFIGRAPNPGDGVSPALTRAEYDFRRAYGGKLDDPIRDAWRLLNASADAGEVDVAAGRRIMGWLLTNFIHPSFVEEDPDGPTPEENSPAVERPDGGDRPDDVAGLRGPEEPSGGAALGEDRITDGRLSVAAEESDGRVDDIASGVDAVGVERHAEGDSPAPDDAQPGDQRGDP